MSDGTVKVSFPDGAMRIAEADGTEKWTLADGTVAQTFANGDKILILPNGQREVHTKEHKVNRYKISLCSLSLSLVLSLFLLSSLSILYYIITEK